MRAFWRRSLAPLVVAAAALSVSPAFATGGAAVVHPGIAMDHPCPPGTNWDSAQQACV
jgi:hypothetical protein